MLYDIGVCYCILSCLSSPINNNIIFLMDYNVKTSSCNNCTKNLP